MNNLDKIAEDLFSKIRGRFNNLTIGNESGEVVTEPTDARFFDFTFTSEGRSLGKVSVALSEDDGVTVTYSNDFVSNEDQGTQNTWYSFLRELRQFAKKRMLNFDIRDINKSNLNKRDYNFLANTGDTQMTESKLYGTSRTSYQDVDSARIVIKHKANVNPEVPMSRTQGISSIYIESTEGEKFKYPYRHLNGARAMARHVAEGGKPYDDFGKHITGLSEELSSLKKFKTYMSRSGVMAEGLSGYLDAVIDRVSVIKKTVEGLQRPNFYKESFENFETTVMEDVPDEVRENWIDQLTIRQFNEELADVFPYIYKLVSENTLAEEIGPEDFLGEGMDPEEFKQKVADTDDDEAYDMIEAALKGEYGEKVQMDIDTIYQNEKSSMNDMDDLVINTIKTIKAQYGDDYEDQGGDDDGQPSSYDEYQDLYGGDEDFGGYDEAIESSIDDLMGQFAEGRDDAPEGDRNTTDENPLITVYDDEFSPGKPGISGHMNLKTYMSIMGISEKYQEQLAQAVLDAGRGKQISIPDEVKADYDAERDEAGLKPRALWIELSQHHEKEAGQEESEEKARDEEKKKIPVTEFVLQYFSTEDAQFPKGETAVLTMVEKEYGEEYIEHAKQFIEEINNKVAEIQGYRDSEITEKESEAVEFLKYLKQDPEYFPGADIEKNADGTVTILASNGKEVAQVNVKTGDIYLANGDDYNIADEEDAEQTLQTMYAEINEDFGEQEELNRIKGLAGL